MCLSNIAIMFFTIVICFIFILIAKSKSKLIDITEELKNVKSKLSEIDAEQTKIVNVVDHRVNTLLEEVLEICQTNFINNQTFKDHLAYVKANEDRLTMLSESIDKLREQLEKKNNKPVEHEVVIETDNEIPTIEHTVEIEGEEVKPAKKPSKSRSKK